MSSRGLFKFRLYVVADTQNSMQALANLTALCEANLAERHEIEVVDVQREPARALKDAVFMTPTLIKLGPAPSRKIVGTLSRKEEVLNALGLTAAPG